MENSNTKDSEKTTRVRVLCPSLIISEPGLSGLQWLIGSPFLCDPPTIVSTFRCLHSVLNSSSPDYHKESEDISPLLVRGFYIIGALIIRDDPNVEKLAAEAIDASRQIRRLLYGDDHIEATHNQDLIGAVADPNTHNIRFFVANPDSSLKSIASAIYEKQPGNLLWEAGCLLHCHVPVKLPIYVPTKSSSNTEKIFLHATEVIIAKFKDPEVAYLVDMLGESTEKTPKSVILRGKDLNYSSYNNKGRISDASRQSSAKFLSCGDFSLKSRNISSPEAYFEHADAIQVIVLHDSSQITLVSSAPAAEYVPAGEETIVFVVDFELDVLCYASKELLLTDAVKMLIIPGLIDQLNSMKNTILPNLLIKNSQLRPYHFSPPGILHPITAIYELSYGETEIKQVEIRRSLHIRLGLPTNRPLLRIANALSFNSDCMRKDVHKGLSLLRDVHIGIPSSGVAGGVISLIQGSYEYHHYLQDGFDDSGWGCAYRSLQTIISWFRLQQYTNIDVPSHRDIQQTLVEIGDKDPSFIGSREWIGAIELSFVLDKLLGVSCKVINVRSGAELPEKCRELSLHFETQGTPIMIGGGVLAYTLLGVDYNEASGDCAFLILDPHYTGTDDHKKIVNGGWCGWKKSVDTKGKSFFLHNKFYNLLLPQRPNMV